MLKPDPVQLCVKFVDSPMLPEEVIESSDVAMSDGVMTFSFLFLGVSARLFPFSPADTRPRGKFRRQFQRDASRASFNASNTFPICLETLPRSTAISPENNSRPSDVATAFTFLISELLLYCE